MNTFLGVVFGILGGIVAGMGMGGGTLLLPLLVIFLNYNQVQAQTINLLAFLPMAIISLIIHYKNGLVDFKSVWLIIVFGVVGAVIGALLTTFIDANMIKNCFGLFLIMLGTYQFHKKNTPKYKYYKDLL